MAQKVKKEQIEKIEKGQQIMRGRVVAAKNTKTVTVLVESKKTHQLYGKSYKASRKYLVHDELGVSEGDLVEIVKVRPISKNKHFAVKKVVGRDIEAIVTQGLKEDAAEEIAEAMPEKPEDQKTGESEDQNIGTLEKKEEKSKKRSKK